MSAGVKNRVIACSLSAFLGLLLTASSSFSADSSPQFISPVDCSVPTECAIQNYVDARPGTGHRDYTCGTLSYERHKGTDFRVLSYDLYHQGVPVLAAADGVVLRKRNNAEEGDYILKGNDAVKQREIGNGVIIEHANGWETTYAHLKKGSVTVSPGDKVNSGDIIGIIGLSGKTEFPHLHFQVSHNKELKDPFTGKKPSGCGEATEQSLWDRSLHKDFTYKGTGIIDTGFAAEIPKHKLLAFRSEQKRISVQSDPKILLFWAELWGVRIADRLTISYKNPLGKVTRDQKALKKNQASYFKYIGKKRPKNGWISGPYTGEITLERLVDGKWQTIDFRQKTMILP
ncbi:M23 family metallopeptidase [Kiloniella sp. EL199]|uniref:M23 family metallopeptidase n=1 Tax=Kiloniella sp. EL199 TaxID=2107581 RepID=UPI000EA0B645|nr:M23 family metallopeptidase [Kiloniella sp. EL199]